jgi:ABC-type transport system involved in multi-copper enzyme maturation permease subunit
MLGLGIDAKTMLFSSFSLSNNFGLILPIFVAIILCKDFGGGTIRNKIICGKSRGSIYLSMLTTCTILMLGFIMAHALLTLLVSLIFFDYQATEFTASDFGYLMASLGLEVLIYLMVAALLTFFIVYMKNSGLSIVMYFVIMFVMTIIGSITMTVIMFADPEATSYKILEFLNTANAFTTTAIGNGASYELGDILSLIIPNAALTVLFIVLGYLSFGKKDVK